jgi:hypothetical protein
VYLTPATDAAEVDTDLAFEQGDTIEVLDCSSDRWEVRNLDGKFGRTWVFTLGCSL